MQQERTGEIEKVGAKYLIYVNIPVSWLANMGPEKHILEWLQEYLKKKFSLLGVVDILSREETEYRWDSEAVDDTPRSRYFLRIYKNNTTED